MTKERLHYIDVAKGILILLVVYGHLDGVAVSLGYQNSAIEDVHRLVNSFVSFYMPCFFVITGYCSNFEKPFSSILVSSIKSILIPAFFFSFLFSGVWRLDINILLSFLRKLLLFGGNYWFLTSLFLARIVYWLINKITNEKLIIGVCSLSFIVGILLSAIPLEKEYWYCVHAALLLPYLGIGQFFKKHDVKFDNAFYVLCFCVSLLVTIILARKGILVKDCFFDVPGVTLGFININMTMLIPLLVLSITGSLAIMWVSIKIDKNVILEYLGKNSLIIYCVHSILLSKTISMALRFGESYWHTILGLLIAYLCTVLLSCIIAFVMNQKYIRFLIGKF